VFSSERRGLIFACKLGLEGIVLKRRDLPFRSGRCRAWVKVKNPASPAVLGVTSRCSCSALHSRRRLSLGQIGDLMTNPTHSPAILTLLLLDAADKFRAWAKKAVEAEQQASTITTPLYHYTSGRGLKGILQSGQIWFTDYRHLNDPSELTHGIDMARDVARMIGTGADDSLRLFLENFADLGRSTSHRKCIGRGRCQVGTPW
jgi:hypothetical protein